MGVVVASQGAGISGPVIGDRSCSVRGDHSNIEVHQTFAGNGPRLHTHAMRRMAHRAREAILDHMPGMPAEAATTHDLGEVVAFGAQSVRAAARATLGAQIGIGEEIRDELARHRRLAELISSLENMRKHRAVRAVGPVAAELAIVVAVMAIGAENLGSHGPAVSVAVRDYSVLIHHVQHQAGLRK